MKRAIAIVIVSSVGFIGIRAQTDSQQNPMGRLAGTWALTAVRFGGGSLLLRDCSEVTLLSSAGSPVSASASCAELGDYSFSLKRGSDLKTYLLTVKSSVGVSVEDCPITYDGTGWRGVSDVVVEGQSVSATAFIVPSMGPVVSGWRIEVRPTAFVGVDPRNFSRQVFSVVIVRTNETAVDQTGR